MRLCPSGQGKVIQPSWRICMSVIPKGKQRLVQEKRQPGICISERVRRELLESYRSLWKLLSESCLTLDASLRRSVTA